MKFVSEDIINQTVAELDDPARHTAAIADLQTKQPTVLAYLMSEQFAILKEEEKQLLLFMTLVIARAAERVNPSLPVADQEELGDTEEENYGKYEAAKGRRFRDKLDAFFAGYPQEDLLAFVEDTLTIDDEADEGEYIGLTKEGRVPMFLAMKSFVDVLHAAG